MQRTKRKKLVQFYENEDIEDLNCKIKEIIERELARNGQVFILHNRVNDIYSQYNTEKEPHETNAMNKMMTWYGIQMRTMMDDTTSKLSELLMQGTNMGIIEGRRLLNHKETNEEINKLVEKYVEVQETAVEKLKPFL